MTKAMPRTNLPKDCWIFSKGNYIRLDRGFENPCTTLPYVHLEHEEILKANGIPYRKAHRTLDGTSVEVLEYWNPDAELEQRDVTLPLFAYTNGGYMYCQKNYTEKQYTSKTMDDLKVVKLLVEDLVKKYRMHKYAKANLAGNIAVVCRAHVNLPYFPEYKVNMNNDNFTILRVVGIAGLSEWVGIFDMNKITKDCILHLQVPQNLAGLVIGKEGSRIKWWAEMLGVKKIQVIPI